MTEEEAKTKWCPMVRVTADNGMYSDNRQDGGGAYYCIASDCVMWTSTVSQAEADAMNVQSDARIKPSGFCGFK